MRRGARVVLVVAILVAVVITLASCAPPDAPTSPGYVSGDGTVSLLTREADDPGLDLSGTSFDGTAVDLADYRGEVVVLNTWYAACPPCRAEAPDLVAIDALDGVRVIGINGRDDPETALAFERTFDVTYPSIDDSSGAAIAALQGLVAINAVPTTVILDPQGRPYARVIGQVEPSTLAQLVRDAAGASSEAP